MLTWFFKEKSGALSPMPTPATTNGLICVRRDSGAPLVDGQNERARMMSMVMCQCVFACCRFTQRYDARINEKWKLYEKHGQSTHVLTAHQIVGNSISVAEIRPRYVNDHSIVSGGAAAASE